MHSSATVAVVINTHNDASWLPTAIASVLAQTQPPDDIVIVDDGSTNDPAPLVARFVGTRLIRQPNTGLAAARNTGIAHAQADYILFLDADDRLEPRAIEKGLACFARTPDAGFVYGGHRKINADGSRREPDRFDPVGDRPYRDLLRGNLVGMHATVIYQRERLLAAGCFDSRLRRCEDYDLYLRLSRHAPVGCHPEIVAEYRWHEGNMSHDIHAMLSTVLKVHGRQKAIARQDPEDYAAWRAGRRAWRDYYLSELVAAGRASIFKGFVTSPRWLMRQIARSSSRRARAWLPPRLLRVLRRAAGRHAPPPVGRVDFGDLGTTNPVSRNFGFDRGLPVDRYYIEAFLERHRDDICGRVLEIGDDAYSRKYGGAAIAQQDILHVHSGNPGATIVGELTDESLLKPDAFDCIVLTQTLHLIWDMKLALRNVYSALKPGGVVLATVPGITPIDRGEWGSTWYWSLTKLAAERLAGEVFGAQRVDVEACGNVFAATAFLQGVAVGEIDPGALDVVDAAYPVVVTIHARKVAT